MRDLLTRLQDATNETLDELIDLSETLNTNAEGSGAFLRAAIGMEAAAARLATIETDLAATEFKLQVLAARRAAQADWTTSELVSCDALGEHPSFRTRLGLGGIAAGFTLVTLLFGQLWIARAR